MKRRVQFTETARNQVRTAIRWWQENRLGTDILADEIKEAVELISFMPGIGTDYRESTVRSLRRLYLRRVSYHLYYTFDDERITIRAIWHARRRAGPELAWPRDAAENSFSRAHPP